MAEEEVKYWHWRNTMKPVRFFLFDGRAGFFIILLLVHFRIWTVVLTVVANLIFWILERRGLTFAAAIRAIRFWFVGPYRPAWIYTRRRKFTDTGS